MYEVDLGFSYNKGNMLGCGSKEQNHAFNDYELNRIKLVVIIIIIIIEALHTHHHLVEILSSGMYSQCSSEQLQLTKSGKKPIRNLPDTMLDKTELALGRIETKYFTKYSIIPG